MNSKVAIAQGSKRKEIKRPKQPKKGILGLFQNLGYDIKHNPYLIILCLPAVVWFIIFCYVPMTYLPVAFQKYSLAKGLWGSDWVWFKNFKAFFGSDAFLRVTLNTLYLNVLFIATTMFFSILIAVALSEIRARNFKRVVQSTVILPHFLSWTVVAMIIEVLLQIDVGVINKVVTSLGFERIKFYERAELWPGILVFLRIWKGAGYGSIVYLATITGMDQQVFEAATIDGASRFQCIRFITLPLLKTTAIMLLIMNVGGIFAGDFGMTYTLIKNNTLLFRTTDNINTYTYRMLIDSHNIGQSSAISLWQSVMGLIMVMTTNAIVKRADKDSAMF